MTSCHFGGGLGARQGRGAGSDVRRNTAAAARVHGSVPTNAIDMEPARRQAPAAGARR